MEREIAESGARTADTREVKAARLAAWRHEEMRLESAMVDLRARADDLGIPHGLATSYAELLGEVIEREAILAEAHTEADPDGSGWEPIADHAEGLIHDQLTPGERQLLLEHGLTVADHEWLSHPDRGPVGEPEVSGGAEGTGEGPADSAGAEEGASGTGERPDCGGGLAGQGPGSERQRPADGDADQGVLPGTERSAVQAARAREGPLPARKPQEKPGGLFAQPEEEAPSLFDVPRRDEGYPAAIDADRLSRILDLNARNDGGDDVKVIEGSADAKGVQPSGAAPGKAARRR